MILRKFRTCTISAIVFSMLTTICMPISAKASSPNAAIQKASDNAYAWLKAQQDVTFNQKIVDSFEDYNSDGTRIPISYTYDQACAAIAFLLKGDTARAVKVLDVLKAIQTPQTDPQVRNRGAWCNSYYNDDKSYLAGQELRLHVGVAMWVCMAVMEYEKATGDTTTYHTMATNAIDWSLLFQKPNGGVAGGRTTWDSGNGTWTDEVWSSTEHNEDIYPVLLYFANNTPSKASTYKNAAAKVKTFLDTVAWDEKNQRFYGGYKNDTGLIDPQVPMDVNPWGVLSLGTSGTHNYSNAVDYVENANGNPGTLANPKYKQTLVYNGVNSLTAYDFDWQDNGAAASNGNGGGSFGKDIWFEGSAFMSDAYYLRGNAKKADEILLELSKKQSTGKDSKLGGIPYSLYGTNNSYWRMSASNCVSSTAWFIIAAERFNPFHATYINGATPGTIPGTTPETTPGTIPGTTPGTTPETAQTNGVTVNGTTATIWFKPASPSVWCDIHYTVNGGPQQNFRATYNNATGSWEQKVLNFAQGSIIKYFITYEKSGLAYGTAWYTYTEGTSQTNGVAVSGTSAVIWYKPTISAKWCDIHYTVNGGTQQNFRATYNSATGAWEQKINGVTKGSVIKYFITYEKNGLAYDTAWYTYTV